MRVRRVGVLVSAALAAVMWACGGASDLTTAPTGCAAALSPASQHVSAAGGTFAVAITLSSSCNWSASTDASWVTVTRASGSGSGSTAYTVATNTAALQRQAEIRIGDRALAVVQSASNCSYAVEPSSARLPSAGGRVDARLITNEGCSWSASSSDSWISPQPGSGNGPATIGILIAGHTGTSSRAGSVQIEGQSVAITQEPAGGTGGGGGEQPTPPPDCRIRLSASSFDIATEGGTADLDITTSAGCAWQTQGRPAWIRQSAESGSGSARVTFTVEANTSRSARTATMRIGDRPVTFAQGGACAYAVSAPPQPISIPAGGATSEVTLTTDAGCEWTASGETWLEASPSSGSGRAVINYSVDPNTAPTTRTGKLRIATETVDFVQEAATCDLAFSPASSTVDVNGATVEFTVMTSSGCTWAPVSGAGWIQIVSGGGTGSGTVTAKVSPNSSPVERTGDIRVSKSSRFVVTQRACTFSVSWVAERNGTKGGTRDVMRPAGPGDTLSIRVETGKECVWQNSNPPDWITGVREGKHLGPGGFNMNVTCNPSKEPRPGSMLIAADMKIQQDAYGGRCP